MHCHNLGKVYFLFLMFTMLQAGNSISQFVNMIFLSVKGFLSTKKNHSAVLNAITISGKLSFE